jgi:hypothetical protein
MRHYDNLFDYSDVDDLRDVALADRASVDLDDLIAGVLAAEDALAILYATDDSLGLTHVPAIDDDDDDDGLDADAIAAIGDED